MSGYASQREVREVTEATLRMEGRDPAGYNVAGIMRDAFYYRGAGYGWGAAGMEQEWRAAVERHAKPGAKRGAAGTVVLTAGTCEVLLTSQGFCARCTACPDTSGAIVHARFKAQAWASGHDCQRAAAATAGGGQR